MSESLSASARQLIENARVAEQPTSSDRQRVLALIMARIDATATTSGSEPTGAPTAAAGTSSTVKLKLVALLAAGIGAATVYGLWPPSSKAPGPSARRIERAAPVAVATARDSGPVQAPVTVVVDARVHKSTPVVLRTRPPRPAPRRALKADDDEPRPPIPAPARPVVACNSRLELDLLGRAQVALRQRRADLALRLTAEHQRRCPSPVFGEERRAVRVLALCQTGQTALARREAAALAREAPGSPQLPRLRGSCAGVGP